ncbi:MAG: [protein-PII] uridylyltransferase [Alphaproteobacteria bacterium]|nr:[protein-PII] uridylyltransferase [Alphaproteobacteria bacterium]
MTTRASILEKLASNAISGSECALRLSRLMDAQLCEMVEKHLPKNSGAALLALGGYGREELCPFSDIDLLFLVPDPLPKGAQEGIEKCLYALWDQGIKVGHAVRTIKECVRMSASDVKVFTGFLDARFLWGDQSKFVGLLESLEESRSVADRWEFVQAKLEERDGRHKRLGDTRYVLEPNIKDGKGSLRDYQTLFWIAGVLYGAKTPEALHDLGILTRREVARFKTAHEFLMTVRCHMHELTGRAEERLNFDIQPALAERLNYKNRNNAKAVERFMKHYFLVSRDIGDMTRIVIAAIDALHDPQMEFETRQGFDIINGRLNFSPIQDLTKHPEDIIRLFRVAQEAGLDIHPSALRTITKNIRLIDKKFQNNKLANRLFVEILTEPKDAALILRRMNEAGVLGRFIPEFQKSIALMQFDRYHMFTVDEHTLRAIDILHQLRNGDLRDEAPLASALIHGIENKKVLFISMLLHDLCKGRGGNHHQLGAELALKLCPRLGISDAGTRTCSWLIFNHLHMSEFASGRDLSDPKTLEDFCFRIPSVEYLNILTIFTTADIMAVGPGRWSAWKGQLIENLYYRAESKLTGKPTLLRAEPPRILPDKTVTITNDEDRQATQVIVKTPDRAGLFASLAGALSVSETSIVEARIETLEDGQALDIFTIQNMTGKPVRAERHKEIETNILKGIEGTLGIQDKLAKQKSKHKPPKRDLVFDVPCGMAVNNKASLTDTLVEVYGRDAPASFTISPPPCAMRGWRCAAPRLTHTA